MIDITAKLIAFPYIVSYYFWGMVKEVLDTTQDFK